MKLVNIMHNYVIFYYRVNCVTRPGSFVVIAIIAFAVTICVCLAISCPYVHYCFPKQQKHFGRFPNKGYQRFRPNSDADERVILRRDSVNAAALRSVNNSIRLNRRTRNRRGTHMIVTAKAIIAITTNDPGRVTQFTR